MVSLFFYVVIAMKVSCVGLKNQRYGLGTHSPHKILFFDLLVVIWNGSSVGRAVLSIDYSVLSTEDARVGGSIPSRSTGADRLVLKPKKAFDKPLHEMM